MRRIDKNPTHEVELLPNEQWVREAQELRLDEGCGVVEAAELALHDFWLAFPGSEQPPPEGSYPEDPFDWDFFMWMCDDSLDAVIAAGWDGARYFQEDPVEARMQLLHVMDAFTHDFNLWLKEDPDNINRTRKWRYKLRSSRPR